MQNAFSQSDNIFSKKLTSFLLSFSYPLKFGQFKDFAVSLLRERCIEKTLPKAQRTLIHDDAIHSIQAFSVLISKQASSILHNVHHVDFS